MTTILNNEDFLKVFPIPYRLRYAMTPLNWWDISPHLNINPNSVTVEVDNRKDAEKLLIVWNKAVKDYVDKKVNDAIDQTRIECQKNFEGVAEALVADAIRISHERP